MPKSKEKLRKKRKRQKSKTSPNVGNLQTKKVRSDIDSESDRFSDAKDNLQSTTHSPSRSDHSDDSDTDFVIKSVKITTGNMDSSLSETLAPSQSLLDVQPIITSTPSAPDAPYIQNGQFQQYTSHPIVQPGQAGSQIQLQPNFIPQFQPMAQVGLSDSDVMRIAIQCKLMLTQEIDKLVKEKVDIVTAELRNSVDALRADNIKLQNSVSELESKLTCKVDDLEQYSRRSCLRISGIKETDDESTDDLVLELAARIDVDVAPSDIHRSHRVGPRKPAPSGGQIRPREIIVRFNNSQARLDLLKGRRTLRQLKDGVFINEDLTQYRKHLAYQCRKLVKENKLSKTWVYNGNIFVETRDGNKVKITSDRELDPYRVSPAP